MESREENFSGQYLKVWDLPIRIFHWLLVLGFFIAYFTEDDFLRLHTWAGYLVCLLVLFRVFWGFAGTKYARFRSFLFPPAKVIAYVAAFVRGDPPAYTGHNPVGGLMVCALLIGLIVVSWSGLEALARQGEGPLAKSVFMMQSARADEAEHGDIAYGAANSEYHEEANREHAEEWWEEFHEIAAEAVFLLVVLHILGVLLASIVHSENLILSMFTGMKRLK